MGIGRDSMYLLRALCQELFQTPLVVGRWDFLLAPKVVLRRVNNHLDTFRDANMPLLNNKKAISAEGGAEIYTFQYQ